MVKSEYKKLQINMDGHCCPINPRFSYPSRFCEVGIGVHPSAMLPVHIAARSAAGGRIALQAGLPAGLAAAGVADVQVWFAEDGEG